MTICEKTIATYDAMDGFPRRYSIKKNPDGYVGGYESDTSNGWHHVTYPRHDIAKCIRQLSEHFHHLRHRGDIAISEDAMRADMDAYESLLRQQEADRQAEHDRLMFQEEQERLANESAKSAFLAQPLPKGKRSEFTKATVDGKGLTAKGLTFSGLFAIESNRGEHVVTHIPTGLRVPGEFPTIDTARLCVGIFLALGEDTWKHTNPKRIPKNDMEYMATVSYCIKKGKFSELQTYLNLVFSNRA